MFYVGQLVCCINKNQGGWISDSGITVEGPKQDQICVVVSISEEIWKGEVRTLLKFCDWNIKFISDFFSPFKVEIQIARMAKAAQYPQPPGLSLDIFQPFEIRQQLLDDEEEIPIDWKERHDER